MRLQHGFSALVGFRLQRSMMFGTCSIIHALDVLEHIAKSESWKLRAPVPWDVIGEQ
jgi:hypothetical protein